MPKTNGTSVIGTITCKTAYRKPGSQAWESRDVMSISISIDTDDVLAESSFGMPAGGGPSQVGIEVSDREAFDSFSLGQRVRLTVEAI